MRQHETTNRVQDQVEVQPPPETAPKACASGTEAAAGKKKKLSLDIEEIGEVLERKISP